MATVVVVQKELLDEAEEVQGIAIELAELTSLPVKNVSRRFRCYHKM